MIFLVAFLFLLCLPALLNLATNIIGAIIGVVMALGPMIFWGSVLGAVLLFVKGVMK